MDPIKFHRTLGKAYNEDISEEEMAKMAIDGNLDFGHGMLQRIYLKIRDEDKKHKDQHPVAKLIGDLGYSTLPVSEFEENINEAVLTDDAYEYLDAREHQLGTTLYEYLLGTGDELGCFYRAKEFYLDRYHNPDNPFDEKGQYPDWLGLAFRLRRGKNEEHPAPEEHEREIFEGTDLLYEAIEDGSLLAGAKSFLDGNTDVLPFSIEQLIKLREFRDTHKFIPAERKELAQFVVNELEPCDKSAPRDSRTRTLASNVYRACSISCVRQIDHLLSDESFACSDSQRERLTERRATLVKHYGAGPLNKNNKSGDATGIRAVYEKYKDKLPRNVARKQPELTEVRAGTKLALSEDDPDFHRFLSKKELAICLVNKGANLMNSPNANQDLCSQIEELEDDTPFVWRHLWKDFWTRTAKRD